MEGVNLWLVLPEETITQITTSLDLKSIIKCMGVCKQWRNLISDLISDDPLVVKGDLQFLDYDFSLHRFGALDDETLKVSWMNNLKLPLADWGTNSPRITSSCNGLVCLLGPHDKDIYICNPILGEYEFFPNPKREDAIYIPPYDLGFCPSSNEYKLTTFTWHSLEVCTLRRPIRWRSVPFEDVEKLRDQWNDAICVNGVFHWLLKTRIILTFDLGKEVFGSIPLPRLERGKKIYQLECMDHCLVVTAGYKCPSGLDIWTRKEDKLSVGAVWTKNWVIDPAQSLDQKEMYSLFDFRQLTPQKLSSDGRIFMPTYGRISMRRLYNRLCIYDPRNKLVRVRYMGREPLPYYTPTFVSPKKLMPKTDNEGLKTERKEED